MFSDRGRPRPRAPGTINSEFTRDVAKVPEDVDRLMGEWNAVRASHLHAGARNCPRCSIEVNFRPMCGPQLAGPPAQRALPAYRYGRRSRAVVPPARRVCDDGRAMPHDRRHERSLQRGGRVIGCPSRRDCIAEYCADNCAQPFRAFAPLARLDATQHSENFGGGNLILDSNSLPAACPAVHHGGRNGDDLAVQLLQGFGAYEGRAGRPSPACHPPQAAKSRIERCTVPAGPMIKGLSPSGPASMGFKLPSP